MFGPVLGRGRILGVRSGGGVLFSGLLLPHSGMRVTPGIIGFLRRRGPCLNREPEVAAAYFLALRRPLPGADAFDVPQRSET